MGSSASQLVGYSYHLGAHLALCHGPIDAIREIRVDDRVAWSATTGEAGVNQAAGAGAQAVLGTVAAMEAMAGSGTAVVSFPGSLAGVRVGQRYALSLEVTAGTVTVDLTRVRYDAATDTTTWEVTPESVAFPAQLVTVREAAAGRETGGARGGRIRIDAPELFGGDAREGGIVGDVDVLTGAPDQGPNDYLAAQMAGEVPGYRGIASLVLRQVELGFNPYLKPWAVRVTRVLAAEEGALQWYPETAEIHPPAGIGDAAILIAMDASDSMSGSRMIAQRGAVAQLMAELRDVAVAPNDIQIVLWNTVIAGEITRRDCGAAEYTELEAWVAAIPQTTDGSTDFGVAVGTAPDFFAGAGEKRRILVFLTDGAPSSPASLETAAAILNGLPEVDIFAFNIALADTSATEQIDNTPIDGVPVIAGGDIDALAARLRAAFGRGPDMNPAHILRECLTNTAWGLGYGEADIGQSFGTAADTLHAEGFGLSLVWQRSATIEDFLSDLLAHVDAHLYVDRRSGRWELKLIRDDYDPDSVPVFDDAEVVDWGTLGRRESADLVNSVTLRFTDGMTDKAGAVSVTDPALVQVMGRVIPATVDYPGIRTEALAARVAARDLRALSAPLLSGEITLRRTGHDLDPGDVIRLESPSRGLEGVLARVIEIDHGDAERHGIRLKIAEDVFGLAAAPLAGGRRSAPASLTEPPRPLSRRLVIEAPYWRVVQAAGHAQADAALAEDPDRGAILTAAEKPSGSALAAQIWSDAGTGYQRDGESGFVPTARLAEALTDDPGHREVAV